MDGSDEADIATYHLDRSSYWEFSSPENHCNDPNNNMYVLLHENHHTGELDNVSRHQEHKFTLSDVQLNTSGIYCIYKQCAQDREQCCVKIIG